MTAIPILGQVAYYFSRPAADQSYDLCWLVVLLGPLENFGGELLNLLSTTRLLQEYLHT